MKLKRNNKGISTVVAVAIILAAIVTVAATFQAFIVPQLDRENAFTHLQIVQNNLEQLYSTGTSIIPLSYSGTPFFSASYYPGQLSYTPAVNINVSITYLNGTNVFYPANGALQYQTNTFPLGYMATPWGVTAIQDGTSVISNSQINWAANTLTIDLYNITGFGGTLSGSGSVGITFVQMQLTTLSATSSQLNLNFTSTGSTLNQSIYQIWCVLESYAPSGTSVTFSQGQNWAEITIHGSDSLTLLLHNVDAIIS